MSRVKGKLNTRNGTVMETYCKIKLFTNLERSYVYLNFFHRYIPSFCPNSN